MGVGWSIAVQCRDQSGIHGQLGTTQERQPIGQDLHSAAVQTVGCTQVEVPEHGIENDSATCFSTYSSPGALHNKTPPSQHPCSRHQRNGQQRHWWHGEREREAEATQENHWLNEWDSMRVNVLDGATDNTIPANGPLCDRRRAYSGSASGNIRFTLKTDSTRDAASCCHPWRVPPGSWSSNCLVGGLSPCAKASHVGTSNPSTLANQFPCCSSCGTKSGGNCTPIQLVDHNVHNGRVPLSQHWETIRPTSPECGFVRTQCISQPTSSHGQRQSSQGLCRRIRSHCGREDRAQTLPEAVVVPSCETYNHLGSDHPQDVIRATSCAIEEQCPCGLDVCNQRDARQQNLMLIQQHVQLAITKSSYPKVCQVRGCLVLWLEGLILATPWHLGLLLERSFPDNHPRWVEFWSGCTFLLVPLLSW